MQEKRQKEYICMLPFMQDSKNSKLISNDRKQVSVCLGTEVHDSMEARVVLWITLTYTTVQWANVHKVGKSLN